MRDSAPGDEARRAFLVARGSAFAARRGELVDVLDHPALLVEHGDAVIGVLTYIPLLPTWEVLTLHVERQWAGVGTRLIDEVARRAMATGAERLQLTTTNDNVDALRFYQRRGFRIMRVLPGAVDESRRSLKPEIPVIGDHGIPLRDEVELVRELG